jgi:2,3-bisphosphoglycerate-dependent phosphoglycerate mutase
MSVQLNLLKKTAISSLDQPGKSKEPLPKTSKTDRPTLYIFRHSQTYDNIRRIFSGRRQTRLTELGKNQAASLAKRLKAKKINLFISPPLKRCQQTLTPLRKYFPNIPYLQKKDLIERDYGRLTGKSKLQAMKLYPEKTILWRRSWDVPPPGGESLKQVWEKRVKPFCQWLKKEMKVKKINVAYCGTNNTLRLLRMYFEKTPIEKTLTFEIPYDDYASYSIL